MLFIITYFLDNRRTVFQVSTQINTTSTHILHQQVICRNLLNRSTGKSNYNQTCSEGNDWKIILLLLLLLLLQMIELNGYEHQIAHCVRVVGKRSHLYQQDQILHYFLPTHSSSTHHQSYPSFDLIFEYRSSFGINHMNSAGWILRSNQLFQKGLLFNSSYYTNCLYVKIEERTIGHTSFPLARLSSVAAKPVPPAAPVIVTKSSLLILPTTHKPKAAVQKLIPRDEIACKGMD